MKKRLLSALLALCMVLTLLPGRAWAANASGTCGANGDNLTWSYSNGTLTIKGTGSMADYSGIWTSRLSPWHGLAIENVIINDGVTSIGEHAFDGCSKLTSVTIPESVTSIRSGAFFMCSGLTSVAIPKSVTSIGSGAFNSCESLTNMTIPKGVTSIEDSTFLGCDSLASVTIPESVTSIGSSAFSGCYSLASIDHIKYLYDFSCV